VWVARKGLPGNVAEAVGDAFLALDASDAQQKQILESLSAARYVRADDASYDKLRLAAQQAGLL
jgi:ABC-type phosphate/phosphonate transport system substrate-binding protein